MQSLGALSHMLRMAEGKDEKNMDTSCIVELLNQPALE